MMQGDAYSVPVTITAQDGTVITPDMVTCVEITIGNLSRKYPGAVTFDEDTGAWQFPLTQQQTFRLQQGKQETQARVVFASGDVFGGRGDTVFVTESLSKGVLPQPEKETAGSVAPSISQVRLGSAAKIRATVGTAKVILTSSLPPISDATKGKYLTNDGEEAKWADVDALPAMSAATKGKMLTNDGEKAEWGDVPKEVMVVNFTLDDDGNLSADKSWDDAAALIEVGGLVSAVYNGRFFPLNGYKAGSYIDFYAEAIEHNAATSTGILWRRGIDVFLLTSDLNLAYVSYADEQGLTADQQAQARANIGLTPVAKTDAMTKGVGVDANGGLYTEPGAWYVTVTQTSSDSVMATADKAAAEVYAAYQAGYAVYARVNFVDQPPFILPFAAAQDFGSDCIGLIFSATGQVGADGEVMILGALAVNNLWNVWRERLAGNNPLGITSATVGQIAKIAAVDDSGKPTAWEAVDMVGGETWEKIADIALVADTSIYELADMGTWKKVKVMMSRPAYVSGLNKNVWFRTKSSQNTEWYSICYLSIGYGYVSWEVNVEVTNLFITGYKIENNNPNAVANTMSNVAKLLGDVLPGDLTFTMAFVDTSVIQDGDTVTVLGVRR